MKTRLPKALLAVVLAAASSTAVHAAAKLSTPIYVDTVGSDKTLTELPDELLTVVRDTQDVYSRPYVKDGNGTLTLQGITENNVRTPLYVREGMVVLQDSNMQYIPYVEADSSIVQVSGKNAHLILDNSSYTGGHAYIAVGGADGKGELTLKNGSTLSNDFYSLIVGYNKEDSWGTDTVYHVSSATTNTTDPTSGRYAGGEYVYNESMDCYYGQGVVNVLSGSKLELGTTLIVAEGTINVDGAGSVIRDGMEWQTPSMYLGNRDGATSYINITNGGKIEARYSIHTSEAVPSTPVTGASAHILVDGKDEDGNPSTLSAENGIFLAIGHKEASLQFDCTLTVTNGALVASDSIWLGYEPSIKYGYKEGEYKVDVYIDRQSSLQCNKDDNSDLRIGDGTTVTNYGTIEVGRFQFTGGVLNNAGRLLIKQGLMDIFSSATLNCIAGSRIGGVMPVGCTYAFTLSATNLSVAGTTLEAGTEYSTTSPLNIVLSANSNLHKGKYMLLDATQGVQTNRAATPAEIESVIGLGATKEDIVWEDNILYFYLGEQLLVAHDPLADAVQAANWGVYKSSQAFSSLLWAPRPNAVVVKSIEKPTADGKGSIMTTEVEGRTLAWGSVYSSFSRNSSSGAFAGAEYSIFGGAIGVERQFACGSSIGAAFGYDWGKASPFTTSRVDQESWHAALYGRAAEWKLGKKSSVALEWSAAVGSTTSEHKALGSDWTQENIQLDARATYTYALTERTALSAFVGAQYYAQNDDSTEKVQADSLQNLRLMVGGGISHKLTEKTTLFGEAMLFNDTMRHNPDVTLDGFNYGTGANPGRLGGSVTAGAQYRLTPDWTLRGSYSYEGAENNNEHRVNVGAVYSF